MTSFLRSTFCLSPPGDSFTRKSVCVIKLFIPPPYFNFYTWMRTIWLYLTCQLCTCRSSVVYQLFDSLIAGCIPVIFHLASLEQYKWHLSEQQVSKTTLPNSLTFMWVLIGCFLQVADVSVYITPRMVEDSKGGQSVITILQNISPETIIKKQKAIEIIAPSLQYSLVSCFLALFLYRNPGTFH